MTTTLTDFHDNEVIIFDTEFWADEGTNKRHWNGLDDQHPLLVQISAVKIKVEKGLPVVERFNVFVKPRDELGRDVKLTEYFTKLTNITQEHLDREGKYLPEALDEFKAFCGNRLLYSFGNDLRFPVLTSCWVEGIDFPFPAMQGKDVRQILRIAGMSDEEIYANSSGSLAQFFNLKVDDDFHLHDARCDTDSILIALRHLFETRDVSVQWLAPHGSHGPQPFY